MKRTSKTRKRKAKSMATSGKKGSKNILAKIFSSKKSRLLAIAIGFGAIGAGLALYSSAQTRYFNPSNPTTRQVMASFLYRAANSPSVADSKCGNGKPGPAKDVSGTHQFCKEIEYAISKKYITNNSSGNFSPTGNVNRQVATVILYRFDGSPAFSSTIKQKCGASGQSKSTFKDVDSSNQFCKEIEYAVSKKYISGYSDGTFRPTNDAPRQVVAAMLYNRAGKPSNITTNQIFSDVKPNHQFFKQIQWLGQKELAQGSDKPINLPKEESASESGSTAEKPTSTTNNKPSTTGNSAAKPAIQRDKLWKQHMCYGEGLMNNKLTQAQKLDKGARVKDLQQRLKKMGFKNVPTHGSYNQATEQAVNLFHAVKTKNASRLGSGCFNADTMLEAFRKAEKEKWNAGPVAISLTAFFEAVSEANKPSHVAVQISNNRPVTNTSQVTSFSPQMDFFTTVFAPALQHQQQNPHNNQNVLQFTQLDHQATANAPQSTQASSNKPWLFNAGAPPLVRACYIYGLDSFGNNSTFYGNTTKGRCRDKKGSFISVYISSWNGSTI